MKNKLKNKELVVGTWNQTGSSVATEIMARQGFEFIVLDMEHADIGFETLSRNVEAMGKSGAVPMARVQENDIVFIRRCLDCGCKGIIVPLINNKEDAKKAVSAVKYPPQGVRGFAFHKGNNWGIDFDEYVKKANTDLILMLMVESKEAVENIDEILQVDGVDGVFIGPYDLSGSLGVLGEMRHPSMIEAKKKVIEACKRNGKIAGQHIVAPTRENVQDAIEEEYLFLVLGMDTTFLAGGSSAAFDMAK